jgi:hypothetical protein
MEATVQIDPAISTVRELGQRYSETWNSQDLEAILALHTDDSLFRLHVGGRERIRGREAIGDGFGRGALPNCADTGALALFPAPGVGVRPDVERTARLADARRASPAFDR